MPTILPKSPKKQHWEKLQNLPVDDLMTPEQFLGYWNVSYRELAAITNQSLDTVKSWFSRGATPRYESQRRLAVVHKIWIQLR